MNTAGINGIGESLVIDRLLPRNEMATIYSFDEESGENLYFKLGHFEYQDWTPLDPKNINFCKKNN